MPAISLTIGPGGSGGVFARSLLICANVGGLFGTVAHQVLPDITSSDGCLYADGVGGRFQWAAHAPITPVTILFETTKDYRIILSLMLAVVVSTFHHLCIVRSIEPG